jgi:uncharacterized protein
MSASPADLFDVDALSTAPAADIASAHGPAPAPAAPAAAPAPTKLLSRLRRALGGAAFAAASSAYGREVEPFWVDWHDVAMPLRNLPRSFDGFRITQLTDLHAGSYVPLSYLRRVIAGLKDAKPDLVVVTGDLVNHTLEWVKPIVDALAEIPQKLAVPMIVSLGNHDYDVSNAYVGGPTRVADALEARLTHYRIPVLRNRWTTIDHADGRLCFVGLEDLWSGRFSPALAFAGVNAADPVIALSHNPDTAMELDAYGVQWTLAGHTHGGQVRVPGVGAIFLNVQTREFQQGRFQLPHSQLYVSRGVGYLRQVRLFCRPEVPTFVLTPSA